MDPLLVGEARRAAREFRDAAQQAESHWRAVLESVRGHPPGEECGLSREGYEELLAALNAYGAVQIRAGLLTAAAVEAVMRLETARR